MAISDRTRKILWVKTGNRCAICRQKLVLDKTELDGESVVGDECHIVSEKKDGPRFTADIPLEEIDSEANLIILCKTHHKMIDDQVETYTVDLLTHIKKNHEKWVETKFSQEEIIKPVRIKRYKKEIPQKLARMLSGKALLNLAVGCSAMYQDYPDDLSTEETELIGGFIQTVTDWVDIYDPIEPFEKVRAAKSIHDDMVELDKNGFLVFAEPEKQILEGGISEGTAWNALHLSILRKGDPRIIKRSEGEET